MSQTKTLGFRIAGVVLLLCCGAEVRVAYGYAGPWPRIFDYTSSPDHYGWVGSPGQDELGFQPNHPEITPVPRPGGWTDWNTPQILALYDRVIQENRPLSFMLDSNSNPLTGARDPQALGRTINYLSSKSYRLDYLWLEFEPVHQPNINAQVAEAVRQVRVHADPQIRQARVGAYDYYPATSLSWKWWPSQNSPAEIAKVNSSYSTGVGGGLNVAMPSLYPESPYLIHTQSYYWGSNVAPNVRSALFWGPLTKFSDVKASLPAGHELVPYINDFVRDQNYNASPPPKEDNAALLKHVRLRGADGYYLYRTLSENEAQPYDNEQYRGDMGAAWTSLDWLFSGDNTPTILNLTTSKLTGLQWSGAVTDNGVAVFVSNLGNSTRWFTMPSVPGFDNQLIDGFNISPGAHRLEMYQIPEPAMMTLLLAGAGTWLLRRCRTKRFPWPSSGAG